MDADASGDTSRLCADTYMDDDFCLEDEFGALPPPLGSWLCWSVGPSVGMEPSYKATADPGVCFDQGHHNLNRSKRFEKSSEKHDAFLTGSTILRDRHEKGVSGATEAYMEVAAGRGSKRHKSEDRYQDLLEGEISEESLKAVLSMQLQSNSIQVGEGNILGLDSVKKIIRDKVINPILRPDLHRGLFEAPKGILLFGPPGTGKTLLAKWISKESNAHFFDASPSSLCRKWFGETETIIKTLFKVAEFESPSIIFMDEVDSLLSKRADDEQEHITRTKNQLLQMMDGISSVSGKMTVVVGATNRPEKLDEAALRRFSKRVLVPLPDVSARLQQIKRLIEKDGETCHIEHSELAGIAKRIEGWNGSDIKALCSKAADFSYDETIAKYGGICNVPDRSAFRAISSADLTNALKTIKPSGNVADSLALIDWSNSHGSM
eukprot:GHVS01024147.1.p1 GENE.GHVS01024147.1~~GHVS01024147.1.p1  ORF type:complete len:435 (-),score=39.01 GHVS01024147.1:761-2065(-)